MPTSHVLPTRAGDGRLCLGFFAISLIISLGFSSVGLRNSLLEIHDFRQIQTAFTARALMEQGWSLAYPTPLFGPPWSVPMEFPLYQFSAGKFSSLTGLPLEFAGRLVALSFLYLSLPACFGLAGCLGIKRERRWLAPGLVVLTPVYLYYSRAFMIESTAFCASMWFLLGYIRTLQTQSTRWLIVAIFSGIVAALVKVTTLGVFLVVAATYTFWVLQQQWRTRSSLTLSTVVRALLAFTPALVAGVIWVHFSDTIKASNPLSVDLTSRSMSSFNFGTLPQRLTGEFWERILHHIQIALAPASNLALVILFTLVLGQATRTRALLLLLGFAAGPLVFANLYFVHDYYFYANGVFLLGALLLAWDQILDLEIFSYVGRWTVIVVSAASQLFIYVPGYFQAQRAPVGSVPEIAAILSLVTRPNDILLIFGEEWAARLPYYAQRRAVMVRNAQFDHPESVNAVLDRIAPGEVTALVASGALRKYPEAIKPYLQRLAMRPDPILMNDETVLYLAETRIAEALTRLDGSPPKTFEFTAPSSDSAFAIPRLRTLGLSITDEALLAMMTPRPVEIIHPFALGLHDLKGQKAFNAHAPTDLIFRLPPDATEVVADFGIVSEAFTGKNRTAGVEFRVELVADDGRRQTLQSRYLSPYDRPEDSGRKTMRIPLSPNSSGTIWFRTLPGASGSIAFAWAYWASIEIR